jgi:hypothetical protein
MLGTFYSYYGDYYDYIINSFTTLGWTNVKMRFNNG